ncbi:DUF547 domain-containing protein [Seonamhaeicola sediminis]|uniref:DUF547 domain-containing protein n=2 Tax=Seonamhaeicola sediminis TaxID=2528206 RepID=A0A562YFA1_9FLAO|nr:DUF547 domain-containing protein [Seonamhaeicola sediminis]
MRNILCITCCILLLASCKGTRKVTEMSRPQEKSHTQDITTTVYTLETKQENKTIRDSLKKVTTRVLSQHQLWDNLLGKYVSNEGHVDYQGLKKEYNKLQEYISFLQSSVPEKDSSKNQKLSYWINTYNAFTVDLILRHYPINSIKDIKEPWQQRHWKLGDKWYNLDEIEHHILRKMDEPRIHFAINCASISCPKLQNKAFTTTHLETQLTKATKDFLNDPERNSISKDNLELSKIFQWFAKDFKQHGSLIDFLNQYSDLEISQKAKKNYKDYNWSLNE